MSRRKIKREKFLREMMLRKFTSYTETDVDMMLLRKIVCEMEL
jgi:hypothetical protein